MHRFLGSISDLIDRHNTDTVLLAEAVVFFRKWLVGYDGVQLFHGRIGHKRDPAEFGMVCKKDHAVGILCDGFFGAYVLCVCYRTGVSYGMRLMMKRSVDRHNTDAVFLAEIIVFFRKCLVGYDGVQFFHWRIGHK